MPSDKAQEDNNRDFNQELADMESAALAGPGVLDLIAVYEAAEEAYSSAVSSTIPEPRIWFTTATH